MVARIEVKNLSVTTPTGRALFAELNLRVGDERVALVGRNGVGKSTLLAILAGELSPSAGQVRVRTKPYFVPQLEREQGALSRGELRRRALSEAQASAAEVLLLDEPSEHLDEDAVQWLRAWLRGFGGCLLVVSHDRRLLADFQHFFVVSDAGCHYFQGSLAELEAQVEREHEAAERRYVRSLNRLAAHEEHTLQVARRKERKKRRGRTSEIDRANPRILLNQKRDQAQVSHGRLAKLRAARLAELRGWTRAMRRALNVRLPLELAIPSLPAEAGAEVLVLQGVSAKTGERTLFEGLDLRLGRDRIGVVGPNGAGKTTLLEILLGRRPPTIGSAERDLSRIGWIEQGGANWVRDESVVACLGDLGIGADAAAQLLLSHKFPLALAQRPLRSLSPGERARAALICLFARSPAVEVLVLDEPTFSLDLVGLQALARALKLWPGGLVVTSHDREFLEQIGVHRTLRLGA